MKNKITERKCKDCDVIISYIPRRIRCLDCHKKYIDNAMISTKPERISRKANIARNEDVDIEETKEEDDMVYGLEAMILILLAIIYDMKKEGLDYEDEFEVLLLWDEEFKKELDEKFKNNNINNINDEGQTEEKRQTEENRRREED